MTVYARADWGSAYPRGGYEMGRAAEAYVHHFGSGIQPAATVAQAMERMRGAQRFHAATQGWGDIGYSWCVDALGNIYEGRGWWRTGAHTYLYNSKGYGICGLFDSTVSPATPAMLGGIAECIRMGIADGALTARPTIVAHRDRVPDTSCCGDPMYAHLDDIRRLVAGGTPVPAPTPTPAPEEDHVLRAVTTNRKDEVLLFDGANFVRLNDLYPNWEAMNAALMDMARGGLIPAEADGLTPKLPRLGDNPFKALEALAAMD